jgi:ATP-dependent Clp protease ATP-binding subunit ClpA
LDCNLNMSSQEYDDFHFSTDARQVLFEAREQATQLGRTRVYPEHLLLALLANSHYKSAKCLKACCIRYKDVQSVLEHTTSTKLVETGGMLLSARLQFLCRTAIETAAQQQSLPVDTDHLLLALLQLRRGPVIRILGELGAYIDSVRTVAEESTKGKPPPPSRADVTCQCD